MNLSELLRKWEKHLMILRGMSQKSVDLYRQYVTGFFVWHGSRDASLETIKRVTRKDIEKHLEHLFFHANNSNSTRKAKLIALRSFWRWLLYEDYVPLDATANIPPPIVRTKLIQSFTRDEVLRMFRQIDVYSAKGLRDNAMLILLAFAGLRLGEVCSLRLGDLVDDGEYINVQIPEDIGKKGTTRVVDIWKAPSVFVRQWISLRVSYGAGVDSPVFVSFRKGDRITGNPLPERQVDCIVKAYASAAGIKKPRITSHMFRATHASDLRYIRGYDIAAIAERLGHRNISTTDRYLPQRGRLKKEYRSLREYWIEWEKIWTGDLDAK